MADKVQFELVAPERLLLAEAVDMVVVPGAEGNFGVLPGHTPMISTLRPEVIDVHDGGEIRERIFVGGGFAEVTMDRCTVLAEDAERIDDIDRAALEGRIRELAVEVRDAAGDAARRGFEATLAALAKKLAVYDRIVGR